MGEHQATELLLAIVRRDWATAESLVRTGPPSPDAFVRRAVACDVHPWIDAKLRAEGREGLVGAEAMDRLGALRAKVRADNILLLGWAERSLDLLAEAGVTPIALKGLDLLHRLYDGFDERHTDDVDLLLAPQDLRPALEALGRGGWILPPEDRLLHYVRSSHHLSLPSPGPIHVEFELHWNLVQDDRYAVDPAGLFERSVDLDIAGRRALRLSDHDLAAHLLVHHFSHYFDRRLKWLVDLQKITACSGFDWDAVVSRIRAWDAATAAGISLMHLAKLDPNLIPPRVLEALPVAGWRLALTGPLRSDHPLELFRDTRRRGVQLYLAAVMLEHPARLPVWMLHRKTRHRHSTSHPLDPGAGRDASIGVRREENA